MTHELHSRLMEKCTTLSSADEITRRARALYNLALHPGNISKSQMAAVGYSILRAKDLKGAETKTMVFLKHQMDKLKKREEAGAHPSSWRKKVLIDNVERRIGDIVIQWISEHHYFPCSVNLHPSALSSLQRFWNQVQGFYRYHSTTGDPPP
jgi:hypothetical protein